MDHVQFLQAMRKSPHSVSELAFSPEEFKRRVDAVRRRMDHNDLDALILCDAAALYYLAGYYTFETSIHAALFLPRDGELVLQVHAIEVSNPVLKSWVSQILSYSRVDGPDHVLKQLVHLLDERKLSRGRIGIETAGPGLRIGLLKDLEASVPNAAFVDLGDTVSSVRVVKSDAEIGYHREAARLTSLGMQAAYDALRLGALENDVAAAAYSTLARNGSEFMSIQPVVAAGYRNAYNHAHFWRKPLEEQEAVFIEVGGCFHRYTSPLIRTAFLGKPTEYIRRMHDLADGCVARMVENLRPNRTGHEIATDIIKGIDPRAREQTYQYGTWAYSVGAQFPPSWVEGTAYIHEGSETEIRPGMVFHLPIGFREPLGSVGACSETLLVTETGCEVLTNVSRKIHIVDG